MIACLTDHCCQLMVRTKYFVIEILMEEERANRPYHTPQEMAEYRANLERTIGYGDLGRIALGKWCAYLIDFAVWFTQFLTLVAYFIFLANTVYTLFPLRPAAIPLNHSIPTSYDDVDGGIVGNVCPIDSPNGGFYEPKINIGVPMLNIPSINSPSAECSYSSGNQWESTRYRRSTFQMNTPVVSAGEIDNLDSRSTFNDPVKFEKRQQDSSHHDKVDARLLNGSSTTTATTTTAPNSTVSPTTASTVPPTPHLFLKSIAPDMKLLFFIPLPFFLCTSLIRELRVLSPLTVIATFALFVGAFSVLGFELTGNVLRADSSSKRILLLKAHLNLKNSIRTYIAAILYSVRENDRNFFRVQRSREDSLL